MNNELNLGMIGISNGNGHPYSWSVIGSMDDLNAATMDDVKQWFKDYYGPNNAVLVLDFGGSKTATHGDFVIQFPTPSSSAAIIRLGNA